MGERRKDKAYDIYWPKLIPARLIKRYQRFKVDVVLEDGCHVTAHCPNSGSMRGLLKEGVKVFLSKSSNPNRKLPYTLEIVENPDSLILVNTFVTNRLVEKAIRRGHIPALSDYSDIEREFPYGDSRIDFFLKGVNDICLMEVKTCTLVENGIAYFPDAPTERGRKHLRSLQRAVKEGLRGVMLYLVQRMDAQIFCPAAHIDPIYSDEFYRALKSGVEVMAYDIYVDLYGAYVNNRITISDICD